MAFTSRWWARLKAHLPLVRVRKVFGADGAPSWEIHMIPRAVEPPPTEIRDPGGGSEPPEPPAWTAPPAPEDIAGELLPRRPAVTDPGRDGYPRPSPYAQPPNAPRQNAPLQNAPPGHPLSPAKTPSPVKASSPTKARSTPKTGSPPTVPSSPGKPSPPKVPSRPKTPSLPKAPSLPQAPSAPEPPPPLGSYTWVPLRSDQAEHAGRQVNRYMVTIRESVDLAGALREPLLDKALHRLTQDPENRQFRDDVIAALTAVPGAPDFASTIFDLSTLRITGTQRLLDGVIVIRHQGIQMGDDGPERHHFAYLVTPTAEATGLLESNPQLAGALVDHLCPSPAGGGTGAEFDRLLRAALGTPDPASASRPQPLARPLIPLGTVLRVGLPGHPRDGSSGVRVERHIVTDYGTPSSSAPDATSTQVTALSSVATPEPDGSPEHDPLPGRHPAPWPDTASGPDADSPPIAELGRTGPAVIDDPDRILELDPQTLDLHPHLGWYLAALSDRIGYEVGTRPTDDDAEIEADIGRIDHLDRFEHIEHIEQDDRDLGFGIAGR